MVESMRPVAGGATARSRSRPRWRRRLGKRSVLTLLLALLAGWLVVDKALSLLAPAPTVGHWKSAEGRASYLKAYTEVMATLPDPSRSLDVATSFGSVHVHVWDGGESGPPVLLVPGHSSGAPMWAENLPDWIGKRTVIAVDPVGDAGLSTQGLPLTTFEDQAEWLDQTLAALRVDRAHVVGHSFGGANAAALALRHPGRVASLTLLEPVIVVKPLPVRMFFWASVSQLPVPPSWRDKALAEIGGTSVAEVRERTPMSVMIAAATEHYSTALPLPRTLTDDEWRRIAQTMPLRVDIAGTKSLAGGQEAVDRLQQVTPDATLRLWPDATHSLPMQKRAELAPQLLQFWGQHS